LEETGVKLDTASPARLVGIDVHEIPATKKEPRHLHHDLTFGFTVDTEDVAERRGTELALWCPVDRLDDYGVDDSLRSSLRRVIAEQNTRRP
jgi:hypothetical protein